MKNHHSFAILVIFLALLTMTIMPFSIEDITSWTIRKVDIIEQNVDNRIVINASDIKGIISPSVFGSLVNLDEDNLIALSYLSKPVLENFSNKMIFFGGEGCNENFFGSSKDDSNILNNRVFEQLLDSSFLMPNEFPIICANPKAGAAFGAGLRDYISSKGYDPKYWVLGHEPWKLNLGGMNNLVTYTNRFNSFCDELRLKGYSYCGLPLAWENYLFNGVSWNEQLLKEASRNIDFVTKTYIFPGFSEDDYVFSEEGELSFNLVLGEGKFSIDLDLMPLACSNSYPEVYVSIDGNLVYSSLLNNLEGIKTSDINLKGTQNRKIVIGTSGNYWQKTCPKALIIKSGIRILVDEGGLKKQFKTINFDELDTNHEKSFDASLFSSANAIMKDIDDTRASLSSYLYTPKLPIFVEYGVDYGKEKYGWRSNLFNALVLLKLIEKDIYYGHRILNSPSQMSFANDFDNWPEFYLHNLIKDKTGKHRLGYIFDNPTVFSSAHSFPNVPIFNNNSYLNVLPSIDTENHKIFISVINTNSANERGYFIVNDIKPQGDMLIHEVSSLSLSAHPFNIESMGGGFDDPKNTTIASTTIKTKATAKFVYEFLPYSLTIFEMYYVDKGSGTVAVPLPEDIDFITCTSTDVSDCVSIKPGCVPEWDCAKWTPCEEGIQHLKCIDANACSPNIMYEHKCVEIPIPGSMPSSSEEYLFGDGGDDTGSGSLFEESPSQQNVPEEIIGLDDSVENSSNILELILISLITLIVLGTTVSVYVLRNTPVIESRITNAPKTFDVLEVQQSPSLARQPILPLIHMHDSYGFEPHQIKHSLKNKGYLDHELAIIDLYYYIKEQLKKGHGPIVLKKILIESGWQIEEINAVMELLHESKSRYTKGNLHIDEKAKHHAHNLIHSKSRHPKQEYHLESLLRDF